MKPNYEFNQINQALDTPDHYAHIINTPYYRDAIYTTFSDAEFERRYNLLRQKMRHHQVDGIIASGGGNNWGFGGALVWLSGLRMREAAVAQYVVFPLEGEPTLICGFEGPHLAVLKS